jgi:cell division transport system ATP-binding protein
MAEESKTKEKITIEKQANSEPKSDNAKEVKEKQAVVIEFDKVTKSYQGNKIVAAADVSFKIYLGEFISLVGPSGAGKSTLIRLLTCEEPPTSGRIFVAGRDITKLKRRELPFYRRKVGVIFQDFKLLPKKTVYENIAFALEVSDAPAEVIKSKVPANNNV